MGSWGYVCSRQTVTLLYIHPLCALATCYPGLTGWRIQGWCSSARSGGRWLFVHRFTSYIATAGRNQKLGLEEVDVCYESINGGWSPVLSKKSQLGWMTTSYTLSYSGRNNLTHQSSPSWSVGDQLPRLAKWARDNTGVLLLTRGSVRDRGTLPSTTTLCWNKVLQFIKYIKEVTETDQGFRYSRHAWAKSWACCWQMRYTLTSGGIATVSVH